jgi:hypothetical protein
VIGFSLIVSSTIIGNQTIAHNRSASKAHGRINNEYLVVARFHCHIPNTFLVAGNLQYSTALRLTTIFADRLFHYVVCSDANDHPPRPF